MQNRINPKGPPARESQAPNNPKTPLQANWEPLSPVNDRIIDNLLCELFKRKRIENGR